MSNCYYVNFYPNVMNSRAFISHSEIGGGKIAKIIHLKLKRPEIDMGSYVSNVAIHPTDDVIQSIFENICETDFLIFLINTDTISSTWMEWEHDFCIERNILSLYVVFPSMSGELNKIPYLDTNKFRISFDDYNLDILLDKVSKTIIDKTLELESRAERKNAITITAKLISKNYKSNDNVNIKGNITNNNNLSISNYNSKLYLHRPNTNLKHAPDSKIVLNSINIDSNGNFDVTFSLPTTATVSKTQIWYIEIRVNEKSKLIPITICPPDGKTTQDSPSTSGGTSVDTFPPETKSIFTKLNMDDIRQKIQTISDGTVESIPKQIYKEEIPRIDKVTEIISKLELENRVIIKGEKGIGKSVLLCQVYKKLRELYQDVLFIRCDDFLGIDSIDELEKLLDEDILFSKIVTDWPEDSKLVILFDSLDAISRNTKSIGIFKQFLKILWGTKKIKTICSVRSYDYEYSPIISTTDWGFPINLDELSDKILEKTLNRLGNPNVPISLKKILKNPLRLKLLSMILVKKHNADFSKITNEIELYNEHWKEYVERQDEPIRTTKLLFDISNKMVSSQKIIIPYTMLENSERLFEISSSDIIKISNGQIQFFHHAYLDYVVSKFILQNYSNIVDFIKNDEYNVFLRPTILFTLSMLCNFNKNTYFKNIIKICESELKYYWKISALKSISEINDFDGDEIEQLGVLLTKNLILQRHFLSEISKIKNPFWFMVWSNSFLIDWYSKENGNGNFLVDYIKSLEDYPEYHKQMIVLMQLFIEKKEYPMIKYYGIKATSKLIEPTKSIWYEKLSKNEESRIRSGVLTCLLDLLDTDPNKVSKIFTNIFTYNETSNEQTQMMSYGTMGFTSNKIQDNSQVIWESGELFPLLLQKNPKEMVKATISIFEELKKEYLESAETDIVEDYDYIWYDISDFTNLHDENKLIASIQKYLDKLSEDKLSEFVPLLKSSKLAIFHKILLTLLLKNPEKHLDDIYNEISQPVVLKINSLEQPVRLAINKISKLLSKSKIETLLKNIMDLTFPKKDFTDEKHSTLTNKVKAEFLQEFDKTQLSNEHLNILEKFSKTELEYHPPVNFSTSFEDMSEERPPKPTSEEIMEQSMGKELDHNKRIELLESMVDYLGKKTEELNDVKIDNIRNYLLSLIDHNDPEKNSEDKDASFMFGYQTVRGLVARGIIRLFYHTKEKELQEIIHMLSRDKINIVRGDVARELPYLFFEDYPMTLEITTRYSKEPDNRVHFFLNEIIRYFVSKHSEDALTIIHNILNLQNTKNYRYIQNLESSILYLALKKNNSSAQEFLNKIIERKDYASEVRRNIPFILKENYLFDPDTQNKALDIFLTLLDTDDPEVREASAFFLLISIEKNITELPNLINKIKPHLDKIAMEVERTPWHPRMIEELIRFLEEHWNYMPGKTLDYLEKISKVENYSPYQPVFARGTIKILNGIFQLPLLNKEDRNRCLAILDIFAMAGWPEALNLLSIMERPD